EVGEIAVGQLDLISLRIAFCQFYEIGSDRVADAAAARMQHHPHAARLVEADLDEVVAAAERAELVSPPGVLPHPLLYAGVLLQNSFQPLVKLLRRMRADIAVLVLVEPHGNIAFDLM